MCPACLTTAALAVASATSTGGFTLLVLKKVRAKNRSKGINLTTGTGGSENGSSKSRFTR